MLTLERIGACRQDSYLVADVICVVLVPLSERHQMIKKTEQKTKRRPLATICLYTLKMLLQRLVNGRPTP